MPAGDRRLVVAWSLKAFWRASRPWCWDPCAPCRVRRRDQAGQDDITGAARVFVTASPRWPGSATAGLLRHGEAPVLFPIALTGAAVCLLSVLSRSRGYVRSVRHARIYTAIVVGPAAGLVAGVAEPLIGVVLGNDRGCPPRLVLAGSLGRRSRPGQCHDDRVRFAGEDSGARRWGDSLRNAAAWPSRSRHRVPGRDRHRSPPSPFPLRVGWLLWWSGRIPPSGVTPRHPETVAHLGHRCVAAQWGGVDDTERVGGCVVIVMVVWFGLQFVLLWPNGAGLLVYLSLP